MKVHIALNIDVRDERHSSERGAKLLCTLVV